MNLEEMAPVFIAVAPNGARHQKRDHSNLPVTPSELANTAAECAEAGASMIHLHVRDENGKHSLEPAHYRAAIREVRAAVGDALLIQVTSEAAGVYTAADQIRLIGELAPAGLSIAVRELFTAPLEAAANFVQNLWQQGVLLQYILYDSDDVRRYQHLVSEGLIPGRNHLVLLVFGRSSNADVNHLRSMVALLDSATPWMACAFGQAGFDILGEALASGGHVRIGFENGWSLPDGSTAHNNAALVKSIATIAQENHRPIANVAQSSNLFSKYSTQ